jgi:hypothetical protein
LLIDEGISCRRSMTHFSSFHSFDSRFLALDHGTFAAFCGVCVQADAIIPNVMEGICRDEMATWQLEKIGRGR